MQPQSKAALNAQQNISNLKSHRFFSPEYKANVNRTEINEPYLMSRLARGDESAFWNLWEQYRSYLRNCCLLWLGTSRYEVDDAMSRASIKALNSLLNNGHNITHLKGWLSRLTHNICVDIIRERNQHRRSLYRIGELADIGEWHFAYSPPSAEEAILQSEMSTAVRRAVKILPCRLQLPSMMRFFQEMPYKDIARQLNITPANVRKRIQQARAIIQDQINPYLRGMGDPPFAVKEDDHQDENTCELPSAHSDVAELESDTIKPCIAPYRLIRVKLRNGMEIEYYVPLRSMPKRIHQRIWTLKKYVPKHPRSWRKRLKLADFLYVTGDWQAAVDNYRKILENKSSFFQVWLQLGNILHLMGEAGDAVVAFEHACELSDSSASRHYIRGLMCICREQYHIANDNFKKATALESDNPACWHGLGATSLHINESAEALRAFDHALEISPDDTVALFNSFDALMVLERPQEAQQRLEKALTISPDDVLVLLRLAQSRINSGFVFKKEGTRTRQVLRQVSSLAPLSIAGLVSLAFFYSTKGAIDRAISTIQKMIELHPTNSYAKFYYARWLPYLNDCQHKKDAVCTAKIISHNVNDLYRVPLNAVFSFNHDEKTCRAIKGMICCRLGPWSIYANDGISS